MLVPDAEKLAFCERSNDVCPYAFVFTVTADEALLDATNATALVSGTAAHPSLGEMCQTSVDQFGGFEPDDEVCGPALASMMGSVLMRKEIR